MLQADLTFIHFGREDRPLGQDEPEYGVRIGLSTLQLRRGLPDLPWGVVFGRPYIEMFGRDKLLSTPAADVREIGDESIYLQLSHDLHVDADAEFERVRRAAKTHLGIDAFRHSGPVRIPDFNLETPSGPRLLGWVNGLSVTGMIAGRPIVQTDRGPRVLDVPFNPGNGNP